jgi:hypothetical protein
VIIKEHDLRLLIRSEINSCQLDEGLLDIIKGLVSALFGKLGGALTDASGQTEGELTAASNSIAQEIQQMLELPKIKSWAELKPKEDNTDKAVWALTISQTFADMEGSANSTINAIQDGWEIKTLAPLSEEEAPEWESGEDAQRLEALYLGIGAFKGWLMWLSAHIESAQAAADGIDESAKLSKMMQQVVPAAEFIKSSVVPGLESAAAAIEAVGMPSGMTSHMSAMAENIAEAGSMLADHFAELEAKTEELAKHAEKGKDLVAASTGMPESILRQFTKSVLIERKRIR